MSFTSTAYPFNSTRTIQANSSLGIFPASNYSTSYGTGGDDTLAVQAALNAASAAGGGVAFLPPPVSGSVNISRTPDALAQGLILGSNGVWLIGASPTVTVTIIPGSNLDWLASTAAHGSVDYRTNFSANYVTKTVASYAYTVYNAALPISTSKNGGIANIKFVADTTAPTNLGDGIMLNGALSFQFVNVHFSGFQGDAISLWDCYGTLIDISTGAGTTTGRHIGIHRACYETQIIAANNRTYTNSPIIVYTEQYQVPSGPLLTLTPEYTKFVDTHCWTSAAPAQAIDLQGALNVNLTSCTFDGPATLYSTGTRYTAPTNNVLADTGASSGVVSVGTTAPLQNTGTATNPIIAVTPSGTNGYVLTTTGGVVGWAASSGGVTSVTASSPLSSSGGATPNITITSPLPVTNGGTGTATPSLVAGSNITVTGAWPNQTIAASGGGASFPFTVVQEAGSQETTPATSLTVTFTQAAAASGNTLLLVVAFDQRYTLTVTGWTNLFTASTVSYTGVAVYSKTTASDTSVTVGVSSSSDLTAYVAELVGARTLDQHASSGNATPTTAQITCPAITPTSGAAVFSACCLIPNNNSATSLSVAGGLMGGGWRNLSIAADSGSSAVGRALGLAVLNGPASGSAVVPPQFVFGGNSLYSGASTTSVTFSIK